MAAILAALAAFLLYANTAANDFVFDDLQIVAGNPLARDPAAVGRIFGSHYWLNVSPGGDLYRPLTMWSFAINHSVTGAGPAGHHLTNAALHGAVAALVVLLAAALGLSASGALVAGLLFAAHPVHVEAVAPVIGRSELLAALFGLCAWLLHIRATWTRAPSPLPRPSRYWLVAGGACFILAGAFSKENAVVVPALVLCADLFLAPREAPWRPRLVSLAAMAAAILLWAAIRGAVIPGLPPDDPMGSVFGGIDPLTRVLTATGVLGRYLWLMAFPVHLSADYSYHQIPLVDSALDGVFLLALTAHLILAVAGLLLALRGRLSGVAILVYMGALFPVSNILLSIGTVMGERLLYLPSVGFCLLAPALYTELIGAGARRKIGKAVAIMTAAILVLYAGRVLTRNADWRDQHTLFSVTVETSPDSAKAHYNLGVAEDDRGEMEAAMRAYQRAIEIKPDMAEAHRNYGLDLLASGRPADGLERLRTAAGFDANIPEVYSDIGVALFELGRPEEAADAFRTEIDLRPDNSWARYNLGTLLLEQGRHEEALGELLQAVDGDPDEAEYRAQVGLALAVLGRAEEALVAFRRALDLNPSFAEILVPMARAALAAGRPEVAREALDRARASGVRIPEGLSAPGP
jgi:tetratricopeptide (TPR) repeat protein